MLTPVQVDINKTHHGLRGLMTDCIPIKVFGLFTPHCLFFPCPSASHPCNLILLGILFCYFLYLTSKFLFVVLKLALPFLESQISMPHFRTWGVVYWGPSRQKSLIQQNLLNTYHALGSVLHPADTMNKSGKVSASSTYSVVGGVDIKQHK